VICYLDSSALVKLYVHEQGSETVRKLVDAASAVATSKVAYPEARAALARGFREGSFHTIHLAAAVTLKTQVKSRVVAACWDVRLWEALCAVDLEVVPESKP